MTSGLTSATATAALSRETPSKETPKTVETHIEKRLKRLWVKTGETLKRLRWTSVGRWWLVWVSGYPDTDYPETAKSVTDNRPMPPHDESSKK